MSTIKVNNINPQSGNDLNVTGNIIGTGAAGSLSGSFSGSFYGDGSNITGVTGEWDGSHTGDASITGDLSISGYSSLSSSLNTIESDNTSQGTRLTALESFSSSLDNSYASEADLSAHSSSIAERVSAQESFSSSLDTVYATDAGVAQYYVANANTGSFALSADVVDLTQNQTVLGNKTFGNPLTVSASNLTVNAGDILTDNGGSIELGTGGNFTMTNGNISSTNVSSSLSQNFYRIQFQSQPLAVSSSQFVKGNISTQTLGSGATYTNIYGHIVDIGAYNNTTGNSSVNIGNSASGSVSINSTLLNINSGYVSASADLIVSGTIESNQKGNKIRFHYDTEAGLPSAATWHGMFAHAHDTGYAYYAHGGNWVKLAQSSSLAQYESSSNANLSTNYYTQAQVDANYVSKAKILAAATGSLTYNEFTGSLLTLLS